MGWVPVYRLPKQLLFGSNYKVSWVLKTLELRTKGRNVLRGRHAWETLTVINSHPKTYVPIVEGRVDPELPSTVTYGLTVKTMFMEDHHTRL